MTEYRIERITNAESCSQELIYWLVTESKKLSETYDGFLGWEYFDYPSYFKNGIFWVCYRGDKPIGVMLARLVVSIFDPRKTILTQDLLYVSEPQSRAAILLLREFIDFGKANANHLYTMIAEKSNIKGRSLEKLGFKQSEIHYCMEIHDG